MPQIQLSSQTIDRPERGFFPEQCINMHREVRDGGRSALIGRSGVVQFSPLAGSLGGVRGMLQMDGVLGGDIVTVASGGAYRVQEVGAVSLIGALPSSGLVRLANSLTEIVAVVDGKAFQIVAGGVNQLLDSDLGEVVDVTYAAGLFVYVEKNSDRIKWSEILNASIIGSASFATAEGKPDRLRGVARVGEDLVLFGYETVEVWGKTGDIQAPFQPRSGALASVGCASLHSIVVCGDGSASDKVTWVGADRVIRITNGSGAEPINSPSVTDSLNRLTNDELEAVSGFSFSENGSWFVAYHIGARTWLYSIALGEWTERASLQGSWPVACACEAWGRTFVGRSDIPMLGYLDYRERFDFGQLIRRGFTATLPIESDAFPVESVTVQMSLGDDEDVATDRKLWMRHSDNRGKTWGNWTYRSLGVQGNYRSSVEWSPCGATVAPGRVFEFEIRDAYIPTVTACYVNEVKA